MNRTDFSVHNSEIDLAESRGRGSPLRIAGDAFGVTLGVAAEGPSPAVADADRVCSGVEPRRETRCAWHRARRGPGRHGAGCCASRTRAQPPAGGSRARLERFYLHNAMGASVRLVRLGLAIVKSWTERWEDSRVMSEQAA